MEEVITLCNASTGTYESLFLLVRKCQHFDKLSNAKIFRDVKDEHCKSLGDDARL